MPIDVKQIKQLLKIMDANDLGEISIKKGEDAICLKKKNTQMVLPQAQVPVQAQAPAAPVASAESADEKKSGLKAGQVEIKAPMVGTFYKAPSPDADPFVSVGQEVSEGAVLCILEAMKLMNEVKSEVSGKIVKILVDNGQAIEFDQPLFIIEK